MNSTKKGFVRKTLSVLLFVLLIGLLCWYVWKNKSDFEQLLHIAPKYMTWIMTCALGACFMNCLYHKIILNSYRLTLDATDWLGVVNAANALALVLPLRMDLLFTATYLKKVKHFSYADSISISAGNVVFSFLFALLQMLCALLITGISSGTWSPVLWICFGIGLAGAIMIILLARLFGDHMPEKLKRIPKLKQVIDGFNELISNKQLLWKLLLCLILNNLITLFQYKVCFAALGCDASLSQVLFFNSISRICGLIAIVPGNIGIKEAVLGAASALTGDLFNRGVAVSLLHTLSLTAMYIITGLISAYPVYRKWRNAIIAENHEEE